MKIFRHTADIRTYLEEQKATKKIAFVPTMGALHQGHLSLIQIAKLQADLTVCSIFVNPTQFNDPKDLEKYPRPIEDDIALLESISCDVLFLPSVEEIYPDTNMNWHIDLGLLDRIWEGEKRPGHFQGVTQVVARLFDIVQPDIACFGQKDFQQVMVIQRMLEITKQPVQLLIGPTLRDENGLALSSRNTRLSREGKEKALILYKSLKTVKDLFYNHSPQELTTMGTQLINEEQDVQLEYFAICETKTLSEAQTIETGKQYVALVVAWIEGVRLIDNMLMND